MTMSMKYGWGRPRVGLCVQRLNVQELEPRRLAAVDVVSGVLQIGGTDGNDTVVVQQTASTLNVTVNGSVTSVPRSAVLRINAHLGGGDDRYDGNGVSIRQWVYAGAGDDHVTGGEGVDILYGEGGNDVLRGQGAKDFLFGQAGVDQLDGGSGPDWLNGGAGSDVMFAVDGLLQDRMVGLQALDTVFSDTYAVVVPREDLNSRTNEIHFYGNSIELRREYITDVEGIFYRVRINGREWGATYRAAGLIRLFVPRGGTITVNPTLQSELTAAGLLRRELLA